MQPCCYCICMENKIVFYFQQQSRRLECLLAGYLHSLYCSSNSVPADNWRCHCCLITFPCAFLPTAAVQLLADAFLNNWAKLLANVSKQLRATLQLSNNPITLSEVLMLKLPNKDIEAYTMILKERYRHFFHTVLVSSFL